MSFGLRTPEALLRRSDSKNPATTCKGLTATGRHCRRALAAGLADDLASSPGGDEGGVVAILDEGEAAAFFCWQHKDQAEQLVSELRERSRLFPLKQKGSIETLIERLGVLELDEGGRPASEALSDSWTSANNERASQRRGRGAITLPRQWQNIQGPLISIPEDVLPDASRKKVRPVRTDVPRKSAGSKNIRQSNVKASWSCCIRAEDDHSPPPRKRPVQKPPRPRQGNEAMVSSAGDYTPVRRKPINSTQMRHQHGSDEMSMVRPLVSQSVPTPTWTRPLSGAVASSMSNPQTNTFLSLIPSHLTPATTSALLAELARPISEADTAGYIYMFWLTPETEISKPDNETASSLLDVDTTSPSRPSYTHQFTPQPSAISPGHGRDALTAQALSRYASVKRTSNSPGKILLKIGRARNVHRRLSQWTKQCGQNITLIRYYPYQQAHQSAVSTATGDSPNAERLVPYVHRVQTLIHLELAEKRISKDDCNSCGKSHKEWFEVQATRQEVREVDEVIRRWVGWAEQHQTVSSSYY